MKKTLLTLLAAAAVTVGGFTYYSHAAPDRHGPGRGQIIQRIISELDLSEEQVEKIKEELRAERENVEPLLKQLHEARKELRETIQSGADEQAVRAAHAKVAAVEADMAVQRAKVRAKIVPHLSEEQLQKMKRLEARFEDYAENAVRNYGRRFEK
ncbi:MAG: Spy/CpxP family protein refolding chaperone [Limisphaerales bacterium]